MPTAARGSVLPGDVSWEGNEHDAVDMPKTAIVSTRRSRVAITCSVVLGRRFSSPQPLAHRSSVAKTTERSQRGARR